MGFIKVSQVLGLHLWPNDPGTFAEFPRISPTGEEISTPGPGGQDEGDGPNGGGEVQALCLQSGGEEPGSDPQVGGEVPRVHWQLPGAVRTRWSLGTFALFTSL